MFGKYTLGSTDDSVSTTADEYANGLLTAGCFKSLMLPFDHLKRDGVDRNRILRVQVNVIIIAFSGMIPALFLLVAKILTKTVILAIYNQETSKI